MKLRNLVNLPLLNANTAEKLGQIEKVVIGDDYRVLYLLVLSDNDRTCRVSSDDISIGADAVLIYDRASMKPCADGEELSVYKAKLGDLVFDNQGKELGTVSDFIIDRDNKEVWGVEISGGIMKDLLDGRSEISLAQLTWASPVNAVYDQEGSDQ